MKHLLNWLHIFSLMFVAGTAGAIRFAVAPFSAGADVAQFWAFGKVFQTHGLHFYRFADASLDLFPVKGWPFVYPPVWLLISRFALFFAPESGATGDMVDASWRIAMKTPIILADLIIGALIYCVVSGSRWKKLLFAAIWLLSPLAWYNSAVFGQFDAIAAAFLLAAVLLLERKRDRLAFLFAGLAVMTKQHLAISVVLLLVVSARDLPRRKLLIDLGILAGVAFVMSLPFMLFGDFGSYLGMVGNPGFTPGYTDPLMYGFSGSASLLTYLHNVFDWNTEWLLNWNSPVMGVAALAAVGVAWFRSITPLQAALIGFLLIVGFAHRVNYQYLVVYVPLAILAASRARGWWRIFSLAIAIFPSAWLWLFDVSFWFTTYEPKTYSFSPALDRLGLVRYVPEYYYVIFAAVLMVLTLTYIGLTLVQAKPRPARAGIGQL